MNISFEITNDEERFIQYEEVKINYSNSSISNNELRLGNVSLLFENNIQPQGIDCFEINNYKAFFKTEGADFPFDIFAASFYLFSRYEEYLPHEKDMYGRYAHENSLAFKEGFLQLPLINIWVNDLIKSILQKFPSFNIQHSTFNFSPTYDIDIAYAFKHKGLARNIGGFLKSPSVERIKVLVGLMQDPFDVYNWLDDFHQQHSLQPVYFFLLAAKNSQYDKNILPHVNAVKDLMNSHAAKYTVGIHPSWQSGDNFLLMKKEKKLLADIIAQPVTHSRQHYIRFSLPHGCRRLMEAGVTDDYSMGYGSINGFRASVASSFYWFDLEKNEVSSLRLHPFSWMDANSFYEQHLSAEEAYNELVKYYTICKEVGGTLCTIWHNNFLGTDKQFAGWRQCYEKFIALVRQ